MSRFFYIEMFLSMAAIDKTYLKVLSPDRGCWHGVHETQIFQLGIDYTFFFFERSRRVIGTIPRQIFKLAMSNKIEFYST